MKEKLKHLKKVVEVQRWSEDKLNNAVYEIKMKYNISEEDVAIWNICISTLATRQIVAKNR